VNNVVKPMTKATAAARNTNGTSVRRQGAALRRTRRWDAGNGRVSGSAIGRAAGSVGATRAGSSRGSIFTRLP
jgi:hypothetical protein